MRWWRRRRRFPQLNHAIPIDNRAVIADSPSPSPTALHCRSCFLSFRFGYLFRPRRNICRPAPRRAVPPIGFRATKLDMVCVPILRPLIPTGRNCIACTSVRPTATGSPSFSFLSRWISRGTWRIQLEFLNPLLSLHRD